MEIFLGSSDPYCVIKINDMKIYKTKTIKTTLNPVWEESFDTILPDKQDLVLQLIVRDWNAFNVSERLGEALICPNDFLKREASFYMVHFVSPYIQDSHTYVNLSSIYIYFI
jgi:Ca2+-dependent lipid-binding protein